MNFVLFLFNLPFKFGYVRLAKLLIFFSLSRLEEGVRYTTKGSFRYLTSAELGLVS